MDRGGLVINGHRDGPSRTLAQAGNGPVCCHIVLRRHGQRHCHLGVVGQGLALPVFACPANGFAGVDVRPHTCIGVIEGAILGAIIAAVIDLAGILIGNGQGYTGGIPN